MSAAKSPLKAIFTYPLTWAAIASVCGVVGLFAWWFAPPTPVLGGFAALGALSLLGWPLFLKNSPDFHRHYFGKPDDTQPEDLEEMLAYCDSAFANPARDLLVLARNISREFSGHGFLPEVDAMVNKLAGLTRDRMQLRARAQQFGTGAQKKEMRELMATQVSSVEKSLSALRDFSGQLTLMDVSLHDQKLLGDEVHSITRGLESVLQGLKQ